MATTQNQTSEEPQKETSKKKDCLCGEPHRFKDCPYLINGKQPQGWKPDPEIQKQIEAKLQNPRLKAAVDHARASQGEGTSTKEIVEEGTF